MENLTYHDGFFSSSPPAGGTLNQQSFFYPFPPLPLFSSGGKKASFLLERGGDFPLSLEEGRGGLFYVARQPLLDPKPPTLSETDFVLHVWRPLICRFPHRKSCFAYGKAPSTANSTKVMLVEQMMFLFLFLFLSVGFFSKLFSGNHYCAYSLGCHQEKPSLLTCLEKAFFHPLELPKEVFVFLLSLF